MAKTAQGLIDWCVSKVGSCYMFGYTGIVSESAIQAKAKQYPDMYTATYIAKCRKRIGLWATDCSGLIDSYLGVDKSADGYYAMATEHGAIATIPLIPGYLVHKDGHVGVYIGNGDVIEARGVDYGVVKTKLNARGWLRWSRCPLVEYGDTQEDEDMIKQGDKGVAVKAWQVALNRCGAKLTADASYGPQTTTETKAFQAAHKIATTGNADDLTIAHMIDSLGDKIDARQAIIDAVKKAVG